MRFNLVKLLAVCLLSMFLTPVFAGDTIVVQAADTAKLNKIDSNIANLRGKIDSLGDSVRTKWQGMVDSSFSASLEEAKKNPKPLYLHPFHEHRVFSVITLIFLAFFLFKFTQYFFTSGLSRDDSYGQDCTLKPVKDRTFSYSRVQLCWWTLIILFCFIWFYAFYGVLLPLNSSVILLLGGGMTVCILGKTIDKNQIEKDNKGGPPLRHQDVENSAGLLTDILSDDTGISIHRLQAVAFNVIFGIGFLGYFFSSIADHAGAHARYPLVEFEAWQLSLLGISAAGYLGLKNAENGSATKEDRKDIAGAQQAVDAANPPDPNKPKDPPRPPDPGPQ